MAVNIKKSLNVQGLTRLFKLSVSLLIIVVFLSLFTLFIFSRIYQNNHRNQKVNYGVTFSPRQAQNFGLDPKTVLTSLLDDMGLRRFRLMSYWDQIEKDEGKYDYSVLDQQIQEIITRDGVITLAIGLRQPRWPECYSPDWSKGLDTPRFEKALNKFIATTVERYKDNPKIISWQLENEFHLNAFGACPDHSRRRLIDEFRLVKSLDATRPVIMSLANNYFGFPVGDPRPDMFGVSIYSKVYESKILDRYVTYPFTSWYYSGRAGITEMLTGKSSMIHELQLEPWGPRDIWDMSLEEQDKSMDIYRIKKQLDTALASGMKPIDMWGAEWWYWRKYMKNDPAAWNLVKNFVNSQTY